MEIKLNETSFFPILQIQNTFFAAEHDVINEKTKYIDIEKLGRYIEMTVAVRQRGEGYDHYTHGRLI